MKKRRKVRRISMDLRIERVVDLVARLEPVTRAELAELTGYGVETMRRVLAEAEYQGSLCRRPGRARIGQSGRPHDRWFLA